jgi:cysteine desulfurase family protein (TIGR01976 family)
MDTLTSPITLDIDFVRSEFPALKNDFVFMDNAGGSQTLGKVIDKISDYLTNSDVQLGASYEVSQKAGSRLDSATADMAKLVNAKRPEEVIIYSSSTMLLRMLSICLSRQWQAGDEIIVTNSDHEANVSCWMDLQEKGIVVKRWNVNPETLEFDINDLQELMTEKTKFVTMVHASNILGTINPIKEISKAVHAAGALFCVDGVAFAPHRLIDVQEFEVDFYVYSCYKVYGPHVGLMYGRYELLQQMSGLNHYFVDAIPYKFQPGNYNYELTYGLQGYTDYLAELHDHHYPNETSVDQQTKFSKSFDLIADYEEVLSNKLLAYLKTRNDISIIGNNNGDKSQRVPTIAFVHTTRKSSEIVEKIDPYRIGIRFGDFYAKKIVEDLGLVEKDGVIRVSMVHYNTIDEVEKLIQAFDEVLA